MTKNTWQELLLADNQPWKFLFLCSGGVMRSAFAQFIATKWLKTHYPDLSSDIQFRSGACVYKNSEIFPETRQWLLDEGFSLQEINQHVPRNIDLYPEWFEDSHVLIGMTHRHLDILQQKYANKSYLLSTMANLPPTDIADPFFNPEQIPTILKNLKSWTFQALQNIVDLFFELRLEK